VVALEIGASPTTGTPPRKSGPGFTRSLIVSRLCRRQDRKARCIRTDQGRDEGL